MRPLLPLALGLLVGVAGALLFMQSMPPKAGSAEERVLSLEADLKKANNRVAALEAADPRGRRRPGRTLADGARDIFQDYKDGKPVTPDDIFHAMQPGIREISPIFERMRAKQMQRMSDAKIGELARKYSLGPGQQEALRKWFEQDAADASKRYTDIVTRPGATLDEIGKASYEFESGENLDRYMESTLQGEKLAAYKSDRITEKVANVQKEADMKVQRLDDIVNLDETQRGQVFGVMARGARDFDPAMRFEGLGTDSAPLAAGTAKQDAVLAVLTPAQRQSYEAEKSKRREDARKQMEEIGLSLPADGSLPDPLDF